VVVLKPRGDFYAEAHPGPDDALLVIEVSDTALAYDRRVKLPKYASAGIPEVWLVNIPKETAEVYRRPGRETYSEILKAGRGRALEATQLPALKPGVDDILG
jgi:Uma2 family endonuclease